MGWEEGKGGRGWWGAWGKDSRVMKEVGWGAHCQETERDGADEFRQGHCGA